MNSHGFPFSAVVGMDELRLALILNAVSPAVGGVLVRGEKGTAKSTMVRALAAVLPAVDAVAGCRFSCDPHSPDPRCPDGPHEPGVAALTRPARLVELPVGATEDRLTGALDLERALTEGVKAYEPGLLAAAHRGVLYVDEVNLLHDHLVDLLLDAAALGTCYVEREGVSVRHAARFLLVGTMNPEEGEVRPQLLDRFGLTAHAAAPKDPAQRAEAVRRRLAYESHPEKFTAEWAQAEHALATRIARARRLLPDVTLPDAALRQIASVCTAFAVDGLRADLVIARAALAHAAWEGRRAVDPSDIRAAAALALPHRRRRQPFDPPGLDPAELEKAIDQAQQDNPDPGPDDSGPGGRRSPDEAGAAEECPANDGRDWQPSSSEPTEQPGPAHPPDEAHRDDGPSPAARPGGEGSRDDQASQDGPTGAPSVSRQAKPVAPGPLTGVRPLAVPGIGSGAAGRRSRANTETGRTTGAQRPRGQLKSLHTAATLMAAAPHQVARGRAPARGAGQTGAGQTGAGQTGAGQGGLRPAGRGVPHRNGGSGLVLRRDDLREARREGRESNLVLFVVDASGSMSARARMGAVKGAVLSLLLDAYQRRDKVGLVTFRGTRADVLLPPTSSVEAAVPRLAALPTGGRTPLAAGLMCAHDVLRTERLRDPRRRALLVLVTDGRATGAPNRPAPQASASAAQSAAAVHAAAPAGPATAAHRAAALLATTGVASVVLDCESGPVRLGLAADLAATLGGPVIRLTELAAGPLADTVRAFSGGFQPSEEVA